MVSALIFSFVIGHPDVLASGATDRDARLLYADLEQGPENAWITIWGENISENAEFNCGGDPCEPYSFELDPHHPENIGQAARYKLVFRTSGPVELVGGNTMPYEAVRGRIVEAEPPTIPRVSKGDIVYLRAGRYSHTTNCDGRKVLWCGNGQSGVSIIGYPGEKVVVDCSIGPFDLGTRRIKNLVIANIEMDCGGRGPGFSGARIGSRENVRIVGVYLHDAQPPGTGGFGAFSATRGLYLLGNHSLRTGRPGNHNSHAIYHGGRRENRDVVIAYNHIEQHEGGRAIQIYGHLPQESMSNLVIHHNYVHDFSGNAGILVSHTDGQQGPPNTRCWINDALVEKNIVIANGNRSGINIRGCDANGDGGFYVRKNIVAGAPIQIDFGDASVVVESNCLDRAPVGSYSGNGNQLDYPECAGVLTDD